MQAALRRVRAAGGGSGGEAEGERSAARSGGARYVVLGSSIGWLCFYGACVYGLEARGVELLPLLADTARRVASEARVEGVTFECADMLRCDLRGAEILMLASQCWDAELYDALRAKLLAELPDGALVLDYGAGLGEGEGGRKAGKAGRSFALVERVTAPVSWDGAHEFCVFRLEGLPPVWSWKGQEKA